jgi:hypothetical protein
MILTLTIALDNDAFVENNGTEVALILRRLAKRIDGEELTAGETLTLMDLNGNKVGKVEVEE